jgi:hypothetical protein
MRALPSDLRRQLEARVLAARRTAESASRAALDGLGVFLRDKPGHLDADQAALRNGLRAKLRQLGDDRELLITECAYEQWHRLLFARFLAENDLLLHPQFKVPVSLPDCDELAAVLGEPDSWSVAARFASEILPGIFRLDDPCVRLRLAPEGRYALEQILADLPIEVFAADDALGWVYQFWQKDKKIEINDSERKIGGADLGPVTQLFTENYMVRFLLENSLGAWWAAHHPYSPLVKGFEYLRFDNEGKPAAGSFGGWPDRVADVTVMDPCCGSGHFLVEAFSMLWQMRAEEEHCSPVDAQDAVLRDNLFGLELDPRCVQIAMFAMALNAWKAGGSWRQLPSLNVACSGIPVKASVQDWKALADGDERLEDALVRLHILFRNADALGSLLHPQVTVGDGLWQLNADSLAEAFARVGHSEGGDPGVAIFGAAAGATLAAAGLLARRYCLIVTNPPFLGRGKQGTVLRSFLDQEFPDGRQDLATAFLQRARSLCLNNGTEAVVMPHNWLVQPTYQQLRRCFLAEQSLAFAALVGEEGFEAFGVRGPRVDLLIIHNTVAEDALYTSVLDVSTPPGKSQVLIPEKIDRLQHFVPVRVRQAPHANAPGARIIFSEQGAQKTLGAVARSFQGLKTGDDARYRQAFWEMQTRSAEWRLAQGAPAVSDASGLHFVVRWGQSGNKLARAQGMAAWGKAGIAMSRTRSLAVAPYRGCPFFSEIVAIVPSRPELLPAISEFAVSGELEKAIRRIDQATILSNGTFQDIPFDSDNWTKVAAGRVALDRETSASTDPTEWLFAGRPEVSTASLQVAVGRLVGYRWPAQEKSDDLNRFVDSDGIVCLPSVAGESPAADRVQQLLAAAFGDAWSPATMRELLEQAGSKKKNIADWLYDDFFKQHCALFGSRPFVWHIWDGQKDGFSALVNYHRLDRKLLEKLTYTYLGQDWVERQRAGVRDEVVGAEARLSAALKVQRKLELILEGEKPHDIYVRWKKLAELPIGWDPALNDGVRMNIRPFVEAGVLRSPFSIHWRKDRGKNSDGSERENDIRLSLTEKREARRQARRV